MDLLISPKFKDTFWSFTHALWFIAKKAAFLPLGMLVVAALFPKQWKVKFVDLNVHQLRLKDIRRAKRVWIGAMISQIDSVREIIALCNGLGKPVILGGPILETEAWCDRFPGVSHFVIGKAEEVMPALLADLERGCAKRVYRAPRILPIELSPIPRYELVNPKDYGSGSVQFSLSCPYHCSYCSETVIDGRPWRCKTPRRFLDELEMLYRAGFRGAVQICDANFCGNVVKTRQMLEELILWQTAHGFPFRFVVEAAVVIADDSDLMKLMVDAGIERVFLGLETDNEACLAECGKRQNMGRDLVADVLKILEHGLLPMSGFMTGFDNDDPAEFADRMIRFIISSRIAVAMVGAVQAQPGTKLYERVKSRLFAEAVNNTGCGTNFVPTMDMDVLESGTRRIIETIHSWEIVQQRICNVLEKLDISKRPPKKLQFRDINALIRAFLRIGVFGGDARRCYWKVVCTAIRNYWPAFPEAITLLIYEWHFHKSKQH